ncbi:TetR/AcrR family transcriptional regulator [Chelatococcus reniformis]|uniref:TetR family transcriptional regulator n=1 Tax=Chelatococcus reniformis TaxID=1494448 RepID=A0A916U5L0_9HYPH|nr:TetR/AcrR family transcriptional regulator [Chelatococcus reniformis]GGC60725.1 TetR family transcriptional regulator [Chelatococcus reniformis]
MLPKDVDDARLDERKPAHTDKFIAKRASILDAAARHFNRHGLKGATLADIAASVDLTTNSVTYYYQRKDELIAACLMRSIEAVETLARTALTAPDPQARVRALIRGHAALLADIAAGRHDDLVSFNDLRSLRPPLADEVFTAYTEMFRSVRRVLPKEGTDRPSRNARAHLLLSLVHWMRWWIRRFEPDDYAYAAERMGDIIVGGLLRGGCGATRPLPAQLPALRRATGERAVSEAFLRAATQLVNEQGFRGASVERIAARINLTKGSFYHHYESKDELVTACFERTFEVIRQTQLGAVAGLTSDVDRLLAAARALVLYQLSAQGPLVLVTAASALPEAPRADARRRLDQLTERFGVFIVDGMLAGAIAPLEPAIAAQLVAGMINAACELERWIPGVSGDEAVELYMRPLFEGILAGGG